MTDKCSDAAGSAAEAARPRSAQRLVLDTHVLLDLWLFRAPALTGLKVALAEGRCLWLASESLLTELRFVSARPFPNYPPAEPELTLLPCCLVAEPQAPAPWRCRDPDDQKFIDLAFEHRLPLWSRDRAVLALRKRAALAGVVIETPEQGLLRLQLS